MDNGEQASNPANSGRIMTHTAMEYRKRVCQAMDFISRNIQRDLSLEEIADAAFFSKFHFHRIFKAAVGETLAEFTRRLRLERAANWLCSEKMDITTIAMDCGFSSSQNFAKAFKWHFGMTPSEYRKSKNGNKVSNRADAISLRGSYSDAVTLNRSREIQERRPPMKAEVKNLPDQLAAYVRKMGPYGQKTCEAAFNELIPFAAPRGYIKPGGFLCLYWDNPEVTPPDRCRTDACVMVPPDAKPEGAVGLQTIAGGPYLLYRVEIKPDGFRQAWDDAFVWVVEHGYECANLPCFELYHNDAREHPEGKWIADIGIPLKAK
jgi:AraC family transcriptional regulator